VRDAPNTKRSALDARKALCFDIEHHWPGASESERYCDTKLCCANADA